LNDKWAIQEIREEIKKFLGSNGDKNTTNQDLWNTTRIMLRGKFIAMSVYIKKRERE
jgi:hypothetical protein